MTKRRLTEQEQKYYDERASLIASCPPEYIADAPFLFANRIQVTSMLSRVEALQNGDGDSGGDHRVRCLSR